MTKKKKNPAPIRRRKRTRKPPEFQELITGLLKAFQPRVTLMDYRQMRDMCNGWVETINYNVREASTDIEKEMMTVAGKEIIALVREKYNMDPSNAASMFLTIGMGMVYELDRQHDEKRKQK